MAKRPTGSNAEAFVRCTSSHVLPQHEAYLERTERGTSGHHLLARWLFTSGYETEELEKGYPGLLKKLESLHLEGVTALSGEDAFVVDVQARKSIHLGRNIERKYEEKLGRPMTDHEIGVSLDLRGVKDGRPFIRDWKFGKYSSWWQLYIQAMAVLWAPGMVTTAEVDAGFLFIEARDGSETYVSEDAATLYLSDLDERADELMTAFGRARSLQKQLESGSSPADLKTVEGKWCEYCGAFPHCPSKWKLAKAMLDLDVVGHVSAMTLEQCGDAWKRLAQIEKNIVKPTKDALRERMKIEDGFPLENGKFLRVIQMPGRESLDRTAAMTLIREWGSELGKTGEEIQTAVNELFKQGEGFDQVREVKGDKR